MTEVERISVFAPATIGNVGPGFDCLGLCVGGLGDLISVSASPSGKDQIVVRGRDAERVPTDFKQNVVGLVADRVRKKAGRQQPLLIEIERSLPLCGGLGASAASCVGAVLGCSHFFKVALTEAEALDMALSGEEAVAGRHLDNLVPCFLGGLTLSFFSQGEAVVRRFDVHPRFWLTIITPRVEVATRSARDVLPQQLSPKVYVEGLSHATGVALALVQGDADLLSYSLKDPYAVPARSHLVPHFQEAESEAHRAGALGLSLSGSGPTLFAFSDSLEVAEKVSEGVASLYFELGCSVHVCQPSACGAYLKGHHASS